MTCETCAIQTTDTRVFPDRIAALRRCEPFCDNGGCKPGKRGAFEPPIYTFLNDLGEARTKRAGFIVCNVRGRWGVQPVNAKGEACGPCVPLLCKDPCSEFGPHANMARRRPDLSPNDLAAVKNKYQLEPVILGPPLPVPSSTDWYIVGLANLGSAHRFCVNTVSASVIAAAARVPTRVTGVRLAGARIACGDRPAGKAGSYKWVVDWSQAADPAKIRVTEYRCECEDLCAYTPEQGWEFILVQLPDVNLLDLPTVLIETSITRDDWLVEVDDCVGPIGERFTMSELGFDPNESRVTAGNISYLP